MPWCSETVSGQGLRHRYEMARDFRIQARRQGSCAGFHISAIAIKAGQFPAQIDDLQVHELASGDSTTTLGFVHQSGTEAGFLVLGIDGQQAEVGPLAAGLS